MNSRGNKFLAIIKAVVFILCAVILVNGIFDFENSVSLGGQIRMVMIGILGISLCISFKESTMAGFICSTILTFTYIIDILTHRYTGNMFLWLIFPAAAVWCGYKSWPVLKAYIDPAAEDGNEEKEIKQSRHERTCPKCGGLNIEYQVHQEVQGSSTKQRTKTHTKEKSHGFFWNMFIGWWWWMIDLMFWVCFFIPRLVVQLCKKKKYTSTSVTKTNTKNKVVYSSICLCKDCGHNWRI